MVLREVLGDGACHVGHVEDEDLPQRLEPQRHVEDDHGGIRDEVQRREEEVHGLVRPSWEQSRHRRVVALGLVVLDLFRPWQRSQRDHRSEVVGLALVVLILYDRRREVGQSGGDDDDEEEVQMDCPSCGMEVGRVGPDEVVDGIREQLGVGCSSKNP